MVMNVADALSAYQKTSGGSQSVGGVADADGGESFSAAPELCW